MKLIITGGAGYIGSHVVLEAIERGYDVTVFDDLSKGFKENIDPRANFIFGSTCSDNDLERLFDLNCYDGVIHLAASKATGESMINPSKYNENNIIGGLKLINACVENGVSLFVFSSSAAVYGTPNLVPIGEDHPTLPTNYYGFSKLVIEDSLAWLGKLGKIRYASLRYFNVAGYDLNRRISFVENNPQNLIPIIMENILDKGLGINVFGDDYNTKDGTGIRDYIHVTDIAKAHVKSIEYLRNNYEDLVLNLGTGEGYSVLEIIDKVKIISGINLNYEIIGRRAGDVEILVANVDKARKILDWETKHSNLENIITTTWDMYKRK